MTATRGPLDGIRVLDLTRVIMGPLATQILADQGADVVIVEASGIDTARVMGPGPHPELSGIALNLLRNKRSITVDLKSEEAGASMARLVESSDVVVTTMRPQVLARLGLDYDSLSAIKPTLVYCQAQGFGLGTSRENEPAYDDIIQAATGVSDMMERVFGYPALIPTIFADKVCGLVIAQAVTAALFQRERTGQGQHVEVPMVQAMTAFNLVEHGSGAIPEPPLHAPGRASSGYPRVLSAERRPHPTKDGYIAMLPYLPKHYAALFAAAGRPEAATDPRYRDQRAALANSDSLYRDVRSITPTRTTDDWIDYCTSVGIPATRIASLQDLVDTLELDMHPAAGAYRRTPTMANFVGFTPPRPRPAPLIGEHTDEILTELAEAATQPNPRAQPVGGR